MKRVVLILSIMLLSLSLAFSASIEMDRDNESLLKGKSSIEMHYNYDPDRFYHFMFSEIAESRDGSFEDLFDSLGLEYIKLDKVENNRLKNSANLYVCWMLEDDLVIDKLILEIPGPLRMDDKNYLDFYVSRNGIVSGGPGGYGESNAQVLYQRNSRSNLQRDSVKLDVWTSDIKGKQAGSYAGTMILKVYADKI